MNRVDKLENANVLHQLAEEAVESGDGFEGAALDGLARSWETDDPACAALALADAQVNAALHLAEQVAGLRRTLEQRRELHSGE